MLFPLLFPLPIIPPFLVLLSSLSLMGRMFPSVVSVACVALVSVLVLVLIFLSCVRTRMPNPVIVAMLGRPFGCLLACLLVFDVGCTCFLPSSPRFPLCASHPPTLLNAIVSSPVLCGGVFLFLCPCCCVLLLLCCTSMSLACLVGWRRWLLAEGAHHCFVVAGRCLALLCFVLRASSNSCVWSKPLPGLCPGLCKLPVSFPSFLFRCFVSSFNQKIISFMH